MKQWHQSLAVLAISLMAITSLSLVNQWTAPIIEQRRLNDLNAANLAILQIESVAGYDVVVENPLNASLASQGVISVTRFMDTTTNELYGIIYEMQTPSAWTAPIRFRVGFVGGLYTGFVTLSHQETPALGGRLLNILTNVLPGLTAFDIEVVQTAIQTTLFAQTLSATFSYVTKDAVMDALIIITGDYLGRVNG